MSVVPESIPQLRVVVIVVAKEVKLDVSRYAFYRFLFDQKGSRTHFLA
jgi:hypothetical protein